jgi:hypothetical protein
MRALAWSLTCALLAAGSAAGCSDGEPAGADATPASVVFAAPTAGATLSRDVLEPTAGWVAAPVAFQLDVTGAIAEVEVTVGDRSLGLADAAGALDAHLIELGPTTVTATARDEAGAVVATATVDVTVVDSRARELSRLARSLRRGLYGRTGQPGRGRSDHGRDADQRHAVPLPRQRRGAAALLHGLRPGPDPGPGRTALAEPRDRRGPGHRRLQLPLHRLGHAAQLPERDVAARLRQGESIWRVSSTPTAPRTRSRPTG